MPFTEEEKTVRGERNFARTVQFLMKARIMQRSAALFGVLESPLAPQETKVFPTTSDFDV